MAEIKIAVAVSSLKKQADELNFAVTKKIVDIDKELEDIQAELERYKNIALSEVEEMLEDTIDKIKKLRKSL